MNKIEKIKAEIERISSRAMNEEGQDICEYLLSFLSTLESEKPMIQDEDFRREMREWVELMVAASFPEQDNDFISEEDYRSVIKQTARHFAQWGAEHLKK